MFSLEIHTRENGFFIKFDNKEECNKVLQKKPWLSDGRLIILKQWSLDINVERERAHIFCSCLGGIPYLHLKFWSQYIMCKLASLVSHLFHGQGHNFIWTRPQLYMDKATTLYERLAFVTCFVEISAKKPLQKTVCLEIVRKEKGRKGEGRYRLKMSGCLLHVEHAIVLVMWTLGT